MAIKKNILKLDSKILHSIDMIETNSKLLFSAYTNKIIEEKNSNLMAIHIDLILFHIERIKFLIKEKIK